MEADIRAIEVPYSVWGSDFFPREVLRGSSVDVAPLLLGVLIAKADVGLLITEVEAYRGADDPASHAHRGLSKRNRSMFDDAGTLYVYLSYGIHRCINIVTGAEGQGEAILIRSGVGFRKPTGSGRALGSVVTGPGRVGKFIDAQLADDGVDLLGPGPWSLTEANVALSRPFAIKRSARIGISKAKDFPWRFQLEQAVDFSNAFAGED